MANPIPLFAPVTMIRFIAIASEMEIIRLMIIGNEAMSIPEDEIVH